MDNHKISRNVEHDFVLNYLISLDCSKSLAVAILYRYEEFSQIVNLEFTPSDYNDFESARNSLLAVEFLRKHADLKTDLDLDKVCLDKFFQSEETCKQTNSRFFSAELLPDYHVLLDARRRIETILGSFCPHEFVDSSGWGPGSTLQVKRREATFANKFRNNLELTLASYNFVKTWFATQYPNWAPDFSIYEGNKIITVPKNAKTNRVIAVEPSGNLFFQKGIGCMIRKRLKRYNVNLDDQSRNQRLAELASRGNTLATVDFSAASDTISYWLVEFLLPKTWFDVMDRLRSQRGLLGDALLEYEKFSSMGNGFTFELESLIFYSLAKSLVPSDHELSPYISIYGDDLICPSEFMDNLTRLFTTCGFSLNRLKSFSNGYYRESCGHHYWDGIRICPTYVRSSMQSTDSLIKVHNQSTRTHACNFGYESQGIGLTNPIRILRNILIRQKVPMVPPHFGDQGIIVPFDVALPSVNRKYGYGWRVGVRLSKQTKSIEDDGPFLLEKLYELHLGRDVVDSPSDSIPNGNERRRNTNRVHVKTTWSPDWPCLVSYFHRN